MRLSWLLSACLLVSFGFASTADAQMIFKYKKKDGSVVYTDSLSELPPKRRAHYNKKLRELEEQRAEAEREAKAFARDPEAAAKKQKEELAKKRLAEAERQARIARIDARAKAARSARENEEREKKRWGDKMRAAKKGLADLLANYRKIQNEYNNLAMKADYTLLPGQGEKKLHYADTLKRLETQIDRQIEIVNITIPNEARKAGIPPGWLR